MDYTLTFPAFIGACMLIGWFLFQRQLRKSDSDTSKKDADNEARFRDQGTRLGNLQEHIQRLELMIMEKVGYDKFDAVQREWKSDMKDLKQELLAAIQHRGPV